MTNYDKIMPIIAEAMGMLGWPSLWQMLTDDRGDHRNMIAIKLSEAFNVDIEPEDTKNWFNVIEVIDYINWRLNPPTPKTNVRKRLEDMRFTVTTVKEQKQMTINQITAEDVELFRSNVTFWSEDKANGATSDIDFYQSIATKSAIYPGQGTPLGLAYVALKMNGEAGEFAEHVGKAMRDDGLMPLAQYETRTELGKVTVAELELSNGLTHERRQLLIKEIGDVLWYLSAACNELGIQLSEAALTNLEKLYDRTQRDALRGSGDER